MNNEKLGPGAVVVVVGGKYNGQGAKICKIYPEKKRVEVIVAGVVVKLGFERVPGLGHG